MKIIPIEQAKDQLASICEEVLQGVAVRLRTADGREVDVHTAGVWVKHEPVSDAALDACYDDPEWASIENSCALEFARATIRRAELSSQK